MTKAEESTLQAVDGCISKERQKVEKNDSFWSELEISTCEKLLHSDIENCGVSNWVNSTDEEIVSEFHSSWKRSTKSSSHVQFHSLLDASLRYWHVLMLYLDIHNRALDEWLSWDIQEDDDNYWLD